VGVVFAKFQPNEQVVAGKNPKIKKKFYPSGYNGLAQNSLHKFPFFSHQISRFAPFMKGD
jgi:hypothetical protein